MVFLFYQKQLLSTMTSPARDGVKNGIPYVYQIHRCTEGRDRGSLSAGLIYIDYDFDGLAFCFCHGQRPVISSTVVQPSIVRITIMMARKAILSMDGSTEIVFIIVAATRISRPIRMVRPSDCRYLLTAGCIPCCCIR